MNREKIEAFWEHPVRYLFRFFLVVTTMCILLTYMPKWFNLICGILLGGAVIRFIARWEKAEEEKELKNQ